MIVDCHIHMGSIGPFHMPPEMVLRSMDKYHIDYALISNIEGIEVDGEQVLLPPSAQVSQRTVNERMLRFVRAHPDRLGGLFWIKPLTEGCSAEFAALLEDNLDVVYGLKVHPFLSKTSFGSPEVAAYLQLAQKHELPVVTHTAADYESSPQVVYETAQKFPELKIVLYHLGLGTDNVEAINYVAEMPNLYGDSCWVKPAQTMQAIRACGVEKILFGTDNPINGEDTYNDPVFYDYYFREMAEELSTDQYIQFIFRNAVKLFNLPL
ncbi:MAG: TatD family hydrolase [Chloroflexota bacterium]